MPGYLSEVSQSLNASKNPRQEMSRNWESLGYMRLDGQTDMTKLMVTFCMRTCLKTIKNNKIT